MKKTLVAVIVVLLVSGVFVLSADESVWAGSGEFSPYFGWNFPNSGSNLEDEFMFGARLGYNFTDYFGTEIEYNNTGTEFKNTNSGYKIQNMRLSGLFNFSTDNLKWIPYFKIGAGKMNEDFNGTDLRNEYAFSAGGGIRYIFEAYNFGFRFEALQVLGDEIDTLEVSTGVSMILARKTVDSDGDGVRDKLDKCPNTPKGAVVDPVGCPKDSDGDGVYDGIDKCPGTPEGAVVDPVGCPKDSDGDGVYDGIDKCPGTPEGAVADSNGCPKDGDKDGVYDGLDKCPKSAPGVKVDSRGCEIVKKEEPIKVGETIVLENLYFDSDKSNIDSADAAIIDKWIKVLKENPEMEVMVQGHTDSNASEKYNLQLSQKRADAVVSYMVSKGIAKSRIKAKGFGESKPVASNDTKEGRAKNRRVELKRTK